MDAAIALMWDGLRGHARGCVDSQIQNAVAPDRPEKLHRRDVVSVFAGKIMVTKERGMFSIYDHETISLHSRNDFFMVRKRKRDEDTGGRTTASRYYQKIKLSRPKAYPSCSATEKSEIWQPYQFDKINRVTIKQALFKVAEEASECSPSNWYHPRSILDAQVLG